MIVETNIEYSIQIKLKYPTPKREYLKNSIKLLIGLSNIKILNFPETMESGYTTGLAYIIS